MGKLQERSPLQYFTKCVGVARQNNKVQSFVEEQAKAEGFNSPHEYIYQLILREQARVAQQNRVEVLLLGGLDRGEAIVSRPMIGGSRSVIS